tara:strand:- start:8 stop:754 length:747 start_codon:yes stop_codon:yes gene_type:complete
MITIIESDTGMLSKKYLDRAYNKHNKKVYIDYYQLKQVDIGKLLSTSYWVNNWEKYPDKFKRKHLKKNLTNFSYLKEKRNRIQLLDGLGLPYSFILKFLKKWYYRIAKSTINYAVNPLSRKKQLVRSKKNSEQSTVKFRKKFSKLFSITEISNEQILNHLGNNCYLCNNKINPLHISTWEVDHIVPTISGGSNKLDNLGMSCRQCNRSKADYSIPEYLSYIEKQYIHIQKYKSSIINKYEKALKSSSE